MATTICMALAQIALHSIILQESVDDKIALKMLITILLQLASITVYFMSLNREARLISNMESRVHERDQIIHGLPEEVQIFILSKLDYAN